MTQSIVVDIPSQMYSKAKKVAELRHLTVEQMLQEQFYTAVEEYWEQRAKEVTREDFEAVLARVPNTEVEEYDTL
jgi:hypothetical protein